jgi:3,4-dihydroxy 2-butanone 4-phosphate synthase/GTP cyclohydrolase II
MHKLAGLPAAGRRQRHRSTPTSSWLPADARDYGTGAQILVDLGRAHDALLSQQPAKRAGLEGLRLEIVGRRRAAVLATPENLRYLRTKRDRMGHDLPGLAPSRTRRPRRAPEPDRLPQRTQREP